MMRCDDCDETGIGPDDKTCCVCNGSGYVCINCGEGLDTNGDCPFCDKEEQ